MEAGTELRSLLDGEGTELNFVDIQVQGEEDFVPVCKRTVCYIVCGILINDAGEVLMMQEAKTSCYGLWYLPAGRMEPDETIQEAVQREVLEETGIMFTPTTMLSVEVNSGFWYRFTLTGHVTGGSLKTQADQDKESLQAKWCTLDLIKSGRKGFPLRGSDILPLIDMALKHRGDSNRHSDLLPVIKPQTALLLRVVFIHRQPDGSDMRMLLGKEPIRHMPISCISTRAVSLQITIAHMIQVILGQVRVQSKIQGLLTVEHCGKPARLNDGLCLTLLVTLTTKDNTRPELCNAKYEWSEVTGDLSQAVNTRCQPGKTVPLLLLR